MNDPCLLVGDIGGTNARFALARPHESGYDGESTLQAADFETPEEAIRHFLAEAGAPLPEVVCLAAAGPVVDDAVDFTNSHWRLSISGLRDAFRPRHTRLLNDFEAIAYALPVLDRGDCENVGGAMFPDLSVDRFTVGAIGPGTGLGAAGLVSRAGYRTPLVTEAGHVGFAPETATQSRVHALLMERFPRVSDERVVSGMGLENIYWALSKLDGLEPRALRAAGIFEACRSGQDPVAEATVALFFEVFGQVAGNLALSLGAFDGMYLVGGIVQRHVDLLLDSGFRDAFERKGRLSNVMIRIPSVVVTHPQPGLLGASAAARRLLTAT